MWIFSMAGHMTLIREINLHVGGMSPISSTPAFLANLQISPVTIICSLYATG